MPLPPDFAFSATSLQAYVDCPRRFELRYHQRLRSPALEARPALEYERRLRQGQRFHKLVQQHTLGLPPALLQESLADEADLAAWWGSYLTAGLRDLPPQRHAEIVLQSHLGGYRLRAKYDLLAIQPGGAAVIVDWKTGDRAPSQNSLAMRMQTVLYRYVLAQAGAHLYGGPIPPERIAMDYFYVAAAEAARVRLEYSTAQRDRDEARLRDIIGEIEARLEAGGDFPLTQREERCRFCNYRALCGRGDPGNLDDLDFADEAADLAERAAEAGLDFTQIAEIEF